MILITSFETDLSIELCRSLQIEIILKCICFKSDDVVQWEDLGKRPSSNQQHAH